MEVKVCKNCKRLFKYIYGPELCQDCVNLKSNVEIHSPENKRNLLNPNVREEEEKYNQVRDYIMLYPKATIEQVSKVNDVHPKKLLEWVRGERLEFSEDSKDAWFQCAKCGKKIKTGVICVQCKR